MFLWGWRGVCLVDRTQVRCSLVPGTRIWSAGGVTYCSLEASGWGVGWVHRKSLSRGFDRPAGVRKSCVTGRGSQQRVLQQWKPHRISGCVYVWVTTLCSG